MAGLRSSLRSVCNRSLTAQTAERVFPRRIQCLLLCVFCLVGQEFFVKAVPPGPSACSYIQDLSREYPYPYERHAWFKYVGKEIARPPPKIISKCVALDGDHAKKDMLQRIYARNYLLDEALVQAARGAQGNPARLRRVLQKLLNGEPITVVVLGGSIMAGGDIYFPRRDTDSFVGQVFTWIKTTFPNKAHKLRNACLPATGSTYISICMHHHVEHEDVDLVILEFDINDSTPTGRWEDQDYMNNPWRRGLEILIRKLLRYKNSPALVYLHMWMPGFDQYSFWNSTIEDETDILVKYYGLQSISFRNSLFTPYIRNMPGFRDDEISCSYVHPTYLGHRYMGDMFIAFLQDQLAELLINPADAEDDAIARGTLPPPMLPGNNDAITACLQDFTLQRAVIRNKGWKWRDEPTKYGAHRYGYISNTPEDMIIFKLDTRNPHGSRRRVHYGTKIEGVTVALGILKSYEGMGTGKISCLRGCLCRNGSITFDATWGHRMSVRKWVYIGVTESPKCLIQVSNRPATSSGAHKLKINALAVLPFDAREGYAFAKDVWKPDDGEPPPNYDRR